jgi:glycosyltransferase involved in cell wall biosynthesis
LEAALCGCAVVTTDRGSGRWYFRDDAHYCDPGDPASIRRAIEAALRSGGSEELARRVRAEFTWESAARATLEAYRAVLGTSATPEVAVGAGVKPVRAISAAP